MEDGGLIVLLQRGKKAEITNQLSGGAATRLAQWIGCFGVIWNAKVQEDKDATKIWFESGKREDFRPIPTQAAAQFINTDRPWLKDVPSQIRRNAASKWFEAKIAVLRGLRKNPSKRKVFGKKTALVTAELFEAKITNDKLHIALKSSQKSEYFCLVSVPLGVGQKEVPRSVWISRVGRRFFLSWSYEFQAQVDEPSVLLDRLALSPTERQDTLTLGIDLGVAKPLALSDGRVLEYSPSEIRKLKQLDKQKKRFQKRLSRCKLGSKNRKKRAFHAARVQAKTKRIRHNFAHTVSKIIANAPVVCVVAEDLKITNMVKKPKAKPIVNALGITTGYGKNRAAQKAGLNKAILNVGWGNIRTFLDYKLRERNKFLVLIPPQYSSQECSDCGCIDPSNRPTQEVFHCVGCGHQDNADTNAAKVLKNRFLKSLRLGTLPLQGKTRKKIAARRKPCSTTPTEVRCQPVEPSVRPESNLWQRPRSRKGRSARNACSRSAMSESESPIARSLPL
jgi:putative transposase